MNVLGYFDRVRFTLYTERFGTLNIDEPEGWDEDDKELSRNNNYHGVFVQMSNNLTFVGNAVDYIQTVYDIDGVNADLRLTKEERHPKTDAWTTTYSGFLDLFTISKENEKIKLKFNSGGIESILKSKESEDVEIDRLDTLENKTLPAIQTVNLIIQGRKVFLESAWEVSKMNTYETLAIETVNHSETLWYTISNTTPLDIKKTAHENISATFTSSNGNSQQASATMVLMENAEVDKNLNVSIENLNFDAVTFNADIIDANVTFSLIVLDKETLNIEDRFPFYEIKHNNENNEPKFEIGTYPNKTISETINLTLPANKSLGIEIILSCILKKSTKSINGYFYNFVRASFAYRFNSGILKISEDSNYPSTYAKALKYFDVGNRLIEIYTNKSNILKSNILTSGKWKDLLLTHGFWIRGFSKEYDLTLSEEDRKFKPLTTNFKDYIESISSIGNVGVGIENIGYEERVIIEEMEYFYNRNVTIKLPKPVSKVKRSVEPKYFYRSVEIGFEKGGEYEQSMGLDEFNVKNTYSTAIIKSETVYSKVSKYRADSYGIEFARRKPRNIYPTEDTSFDTDVFLVDSKNVNTIPLPWNNTYPTTYTPRLWNDDFESIPTGIYSPETAFNLRISPFNSLLRHGWFFGGCLIKYPNDLVKYKSSTGNSMLNTGYPENGEIQNNELSRPRFTPDIIEFEHEVDFEVSQALVGKTTVNGKNIPNVYGLIEFINEKAEIERGYLLSVKPNGSGKWKLIKAYR